MAKQPLLEILQLHLVQLAGVGRQLEVPLPRGGDDDLQQRRQRAALRHPVPVEPPPGEEDDEGGAHDCRKHDARGAPADALLGVDDDGDAEQDAGAERAVPPVEEGHLLHPLRLVALVELVGAEALQRRLVPAGADGDQVDAHEEERLVQVQRVVRLQAWRQLRRHQQDQTQQVDDGGEDDGGEPAEVAVGGEAAKQRHQRGDAHPVVHVLGGDLHLLLQNLGEVYHQARCYPEIAQPLAELNQDDEHCSLPRPGGSAEGRPPLVIDR
uniref:Uncharacterized protein n=1 Tax=Arundo donax TaxID=35708 RepID=A0A0A9HNK4_ARUDO